MSHAQNVPPNKDAEGEYPIASCWRPVLTRIVQAISEGDYALAHAGLANVEVPDDVPSHIEECISAYGETVIELPDSSWETSISRWMNTHWEILVDLWTAESGPSDLALHARVFEDGSGYQFVIDSVHVP